MRKSHLSRSILVSLAFAGVLSALATSALGQSCVPFVGLETGPHDYRAPPQDVLFRVEKFHYNSDVEYLRKGLSTVNIGEDLEFVLRYFPNHHRALNSMVKLGIRERTDRPRGNHDTIDCWFERALVFRADDGMVNLLYAIWLVKRNAPAEATKQLARARANAPPGNANFEYNMGITYLDVGDFERALEAAHAAYALGYPLKGLQDRLQRAGKWRPAPAAAAQGDTPADPSASKKQ